MSVPAKLGRNGFVCPLKVKVKYGVQDEEHGQLQQPPF